MSITDMTGTPNVDGVFEVTGRELVAVLAAMTSFGAPEGHPAVDGAILAMTSHDIGPEEFSEITDRLLSLLNPEGFANRDAIEAAFADQVVAEALAPFN